MNEYHECKLKSQVPLQDQEVFPELPQEVWLSLAQEGGPSSATLPEKTAGAHLRLESVGILSYPVDVTQP